MPRGNLTLNVASGDLTPSSPGPAPSSRLRRPEQSLSEDAPGDRREMRRATWNRRREAAPAPDNRSDRPRRLELRAGIGEEEELLARLEAVFERPILEVLPETERQARSGHSEGAGNDGGSQDVG